MANPIVITLLIPPAQGASGGWVALDSTGGIWRGDGLTRGPHIDWYRVPQEYIST
jgi:hypothetical protein